MESYDDIVLTRDNFDENYLDYFELAHGNMMFSIINDEQIEAKFTIFASDDDNNNYEVIVVLTKDQYIRLYNETTLDTPATKVKEILVEMGFIEA